MWSTSCHCCVVPMVRKCCLARVTRHSNSCTQWTLGTKWTLVTWGPRRWGVGLFHWTPVWSHYEGTTEPGISSHNNADKQYWNYRHNMFLRKLSYSILEITRATAILPGRSHPCVTRRNAASVSGFSSPKERQSVRRHMLQTHSPYSLFPHYHCG